MMKSWDWFNNNFLPPQEYNLYPKKDHPNYGVNSQNYRCPEFNTIDWANSYVLLGGSDVYGEGLKDNETMSYFLEQLLETPVINLGVTACSDQHIVLVMSMLAKHYTPKAWIVGWSDDSRWLHWDSKATNSVDVQAHRASHEHYCSAPWPHLMESLSWYASQARVTAQAIGKDRLIEFGQDKIPIFKEWNVPTFATVDFAVDNDHMGVETQKIAANLIYQLIKERGL
jgi:hypothetical protein